MPSRDFINQALSDSHLRAIGKVAAQWSHLERTILESISDAARIKFDDLIVLIGTMGARTWFDMLRAFTGDHKNKKSELSKLWDTIDPLQRKRNEIVHGFWLADYSVIPDGKGNFDIYFRKLTSKHKAQGEGIVNKKSAPRISLEYTAREMLTVARQIREAERKLFAWMHDWKTARQHTGAKPVHLPSLHPGNNSKARPLRLRSSRK